MRQTRRAFVVQWPDWVSYRLLVKQISPDKDMGFRCTTATFTLLLNHWTSSSCTQSTSWGRLCKLVPELSLICDFCSSARSFALRLPPDLSSWKSPCLRLVVIVQWCEAKGINRSQGTYDHRHYPPTLVLLQGTFTP